MAVRDDWKMMTVWYHGEWWSVLASSNRNSKQDMLLHLFEQYSSIQH